ncbi:hypothetical protein BJ508DRAFT_419179 [Ascobolus immersus RN42]|uniref:Uncharacterized protein n=1 Tax=Ascobolus immersus RN42 TaxID=1160509 RepID=A0A3N4HKQ3_ASCIM|nr:hypothetical protein BJ508DRAFT_419179 [Ascobolus immersus RN42]
MSNGYGRYGPRRTEEREEYGSTFSIVGSSSVAYGTHQQSTIPLAMPEPSAFNANEDMVHPGTNLPHWSCDSDVFSQTYQRELHYQSESTHHEDHQRQSVLAHQYQAFSKQTGGYTHESHSLRHQSWSHDQQGRYSRPPPIPDRKPAVPQKIPLSPPSAPPPQSLQPLQPPSPLTLSWHPTAHRFQHENQPENTASATSAPDPDHKGSNSSVWDMSTGYKVRKSGATSRPGANVSAVPWPIHDGTRNQQNLNSYHPQFPQKSYLQISELDSSEPAATELADTSRFMRTGLPTELVELEDTSTNYGKANRQETNSGLVGFGMAANEVPSPSSVANQDPSCLHSTVHKMTLAPMKPSGESRKRTWRSEDAVADASQNFGEGRFRHGVSKGKAFGRRVKQKLDEKGLKLRD